MPILGFKDIPDMFDGGGAGKSDPGNYSWEGTPFAGGGGDGKNSGLLSGIGSLVGMALGGPAGSAIGAGLGNLLGGGSIGSALKTGAGSFLTGKLGGGAGSAVMSVLGGGGSPQEALSQMFGGGGQGQGQAPQGPGGPVQQQGGAPGQGQGQGFGQGLMSILGSPLVMAALLKATEPKNVEVATPEQRRQLETGERLPDYQGTPAFDYRGYSNYAKGGFIEGPGTGQSDSIPARIYQNGGPVREAKLSDGEFVMTNRAVRGAGSGDRARGAAAMYRMMNDFERRA